jgi:hypothetical protein
MPIPLKKLLWRRMVRSRSSHGLMASTPVVPPLASSYCRHSLRCRDLCGGYHRPRHIVPFRVIPNRTEKDGKALTTGTDAHGDRLLITEFRTAARYGLCCDRNPRGYVQLNTDRTADHRDRAWREARASEPQAVARSTSLEGLSHLRGACSDGVAR